MIKNKFTSFIGIAMALMMCFTVPACVTDDGGQTGGGEGEGGQTGGEPTSVGLTISETEHTMNVGYTYQLTASTNDASAYVLYWSSSNTQVASVLSGNVTANAPGTADIQVEARKKGTTKALETKTCKITVTDFKLELDKSSVVLFPNEDFNTVELNASLEGGTGNIEWTSSNPQVATVNDEGLVTGNMFGTTVITASSGELYDECRVTVADTFAVKIGETVSLSAKASDAEWKSADQSVATVSGGTVSGVSRGTTVITATSGQTSKNFVVTVAKEEEMTQYALIKGNKAAASQDAGKFYYLLESSMVKTSAVPAYKNGLICYDVTSVGESGANFAYIRYQPDSTGGIFYKTKLFIYSSDVAVVEINSVANTVNAGVNVIEGTFTSKAPSEGTPYQFKFKSAATFLIDLVMEESVPEVPITLDRTQLELLTEEGSNTATLTATYKEGSVFTWETSDDRVATVQDGVVTAVGEGTCDITASCEGKSAVCKVTVSSKSVTLNKTYVNLYLQQDEDGTTHNTFTLTAQASDGSQVSWATSDEQTVSVDGGVITGLKRGYATVTASIDGAKRDCLVYVTDTASSYKTPKGNKSDFSGDTLAGVWTNGNDATWPCNYNDGNLEITLKNALTSKDKFMLRYLPFNEKVEITYTVTVSEGGLTLNDGGTAGVVELTAEQAAAGKTITTVVTISSANPYWQLAIYGNAAGALVTISDIVIKAVG